MEVKYIIGISVLAICTLFAVVWSSMGTVALISGGIVAVAGEGIDGSVQFNDNGTLSGSSDLTYNKTTNTLLLGNNITSSYFEVSALPVLSVLNPMLFFNSTTGSFGAGFNVVAEPVSVFASAIALGGTLDTDAPAYTVQAVGDYTFSVHSKVVKDRGIGIGLKSYVDGYEGIAIGGTDSSLGTGAKVYSDSSIALGYDTIVNSSRSIAIGGKVETKGDGFSYGATSIGYDIDNTRGLTIGQTILHDGYSSTSVGSDLDTSGLFTSNVGADNDINSSGLYGDAGNGYSTVLGNFNSVAGTGSLGVGTGVRVTNNHAGVIGISDLPATKTYVVANNITNSILIGFNINTTQYDSIHAEGLKGVRIGAITGESITMTGDDLYVSDNTEIDGFLVLGVNTETNLSSGDINASTIYYDTLTAKSPTFLCESDTNWCQITVPQYQKSLYAKFSEDWDIEQVNFDGVEYTPQQFVQQVCPTNAKTQSTCDEIIAKYQKMKAKRTADTQRQSDKESCEAQGGQMNKEQCFKTVTNTVSYADAVETYNHHTYSYKTENVLGLDESLQIVTYQQRVKDSIISTETRYRFKDGCSWNEANNYICVSQEVINV